MTRINDILGARASLHAALEQMGTAMAHARKGGVGDDEMAHIVELIRREQERLVVESALVRGMTGISFRVLGVPAPKGSFRISRKRGGKGFTVRKDSDKTETWERVVAASAKAELHAGGWLARDPPFVGVPLRARLTFYMPRPPSCRRKAPMVKPDIDKLVRSTLDAMEGVAFDQDSRVVHLTASKTYATDLRPPGCWIELEDM